MGKGKSANFWAGMCHGCVRMRDDASPSPRSDQPGSTMMRLCHLCSGLPMPPSQNLNFPAISIIL